MRILASFERVGLDYAIFGGVALNFHGIVRATEDLRADAAFLKDKFGLEEEGTTKYGGT